MRRTPIDRSRLGAGWREDHAWHATLRPEHPRFASSLERIGLTHRLEWKRPLAARVDLRRFCSPVEFQGKYDTCGAHVVAGMIELLELESRRELVPMSRLFLFHVAHRFVDGDAAANDSKGVYLRQLMGVAALIGVPPEKHWPYLDTSRSDDPRLHAEPDAFAYALARRFEALEYFRIDSPKSAPRRAKVAPAEFLRRMKHCVAAGLPCSLGFPMYVEPLEQAVHDGAIPWPGPRDEFFANHAVLVVGYDDRKTIAHAGHRSAATKGALLFKNSFSTRWGEKGYGWLPYEYVLRGAANDCWTMVAADWIDAGAFDLPLAAAKKAGR
jgi:C1A family cysteine protease